MAPSVTELPSLCSRHSTINLPRETISRATLVLFVRAGVLIGVSLSTDDLAAGTVDVSGVSPVCFGWDACCLTDGAQRVRAREALPPGHGRGGCRGAPWGRP